MAGIDAITLDDVKEFVATAYTRANLTRRAVAATLPAEIEARLRPRSRALPAGPALAPRRAASRAARRTGIEVEIVEKDTRATAISFGFPIDVDARAPGLRRALAGAHLARRAPLLDRRTSTSASARCAA